MVLLINCWSWQGPVACKTTGKTESCQPVSEEESKYLLWYLPLVLNGSKIDNGTVNTSAENINLWNGIVAYYPFNGNAKDESGPNSNHGTVNGATTAFVSGRVGNAIQFNNAYHSEAVGYLNNYVSFPRSSLSSIASVCHWIKFNYNAHTGNHPCTSFFMGDGVSAFLNFHISYDRKLFLLMANSVSSVTSTEFLLDTNWNLACLTLENSILKLYVNGNHIDSKAINFSYNLNNYYQEVALHRWWVTAASSRYNGEVDDLRIYNRILNATEIRSLYQNSNTAPTPANSGTITISNLASTSLTLNWTKANDSGTGGEYVTPQSNLQYKVFQSTSNNISTVDTAETNGTVIQNWTSDINSFNVTGLTAGTTYYFNVLVRDEHGNRGVYNSIAKTFIVFVDGSSDYGINKIKLKNAEYPQLISFNSKLYAIWREINENSKYQIRIARYDEDGLLGKWNFVDGDGVNGINKDSSKNAFTPQLIVYNSGLYAAWSEENASGVLQIRVAKYNSNDLLPAWLFVDGSGINGINKDSSKNALTPQLTVYNSGLYATWSEGYKIRVVKYNGNDVSPVWSFVDGNAINGINYSSNYASSPKITVSNSGLYAIWSEWNLSNIYQIRVAKYNGNDISPAWSFVDGNAINGINYNSNLHGFAAYSLDYNSALYSIWQELDNANQIRVAKYNGTAWLLVDGNALSGINYNSSKSSYNPQLVIFNLNLYAIWSEKDGNNIQQIRVAKYNGNDVSPSWLFINDSGINWNSGQNAILPKLSIFNSGLYAIWQELNAEGIYQIRVARIK